MNKAAFFKRVEEIRERYHGKAKQHSPLIEQEAVHGEERNDFGFTHQAPLVGSASETSRCVVEALKERHLEVADHQAEMLQLIRHLNHLQAGGYLTYHLLRHEESKRPHLQVFFSHFETPQPDQGFEPAGQNKHPN